VNAELPRPISEIEATLIREALAVAPLPEAHAAMLENLSNLQVVYRCPCGCGSVSFAIPEGRETKLTRVADAQGKTSTGEMVGFMVRATPEQVAHIEVYWHHTEGAPLPEPGSLEPWRGRTV